LPVLLLAILIMLPAEASAQPIVQTGNLPLTVAEESDFTRTATFDEVWNWLGEMQALGAGIHITTTGLTTEGRAMPLVTLARPLVTTTAEAHASGKPVIYLQGNIHAGEVEGKDALLMFIRDITLGEAKRLLDDVILLINPIFNADGNEMWGPVERNRRGQDGPEEVGLRYNGMGLDLNRDFIKAEAPETRGALAGILNTWQPHLFMDLHTTNGSHHSYDLTYAAAMTPTAPQGPVDFTNEVLLPEVKARVATRGHALFDYGNHGGGTPPTTWRTFGWQPRYASNYVGTRGAISILSEAVSYRPFRTRLSATYWFVRETVAFAGRNAETILELMRRTADEIVTWGSNPETAPELGVNFELVSRGRELVTWEVSETLENPSGGRRMRRYTGQIEEALMDVFNVFKPVATRPFPAGYLIPTAFPEAVELLLRHGVVVEQLDAATEVSAAAFLVDSLSVARRPYQGHRMVTLQGDYHDVEREVPAGWYWVSTAQPLGALIFTMLEPEIDDSLFTWNFFDRSLNRGRDVPVLKLMTVPAVSRTRITRVTGR